MEKSRERPWDRKASHYKEQRQLERGGKSKTNDQRKIRLRRKEKKGRKKKGKEEERDGERKRLRRRRVESSSERADAATINDKIYLWPVTRVCQYCQALRFPNESLNCGHNVKVSLPPLEEYPTHLRDLLTESTIDLMNFHHNLR